MSTYKQRRRAALKRPRGTIADYQRMLADATSRNPVARVVRAIRPQVKPSGKIYSRKQEDET